MTSNAGGFVGAWLADTLFFVFGSLAYPIPFITAFSAWVFFRNRDEDDQIDLMIWGTRLLGLTVLILTSCGLADINFDDIWYFSSGGVIGDVLTSLSLPTLNVLGTTLVLLFLWGAGFTLLTGISWLRIVEWIGDSVLSLSAAIVNKVRGTKEEVYEPVLVDQEADDADELPRFSADSVVEEKQPKAKKQYNIHVPESVPGASVAEHSVEGHSFENNDAYDPLFARPEEEATPSATQHVEEAPQQAPIQTEVEPVTPASIQPQKSMQPEEPQIERTRQLGATIEELENAARFSDDYANQESEPEPPVTTGMTLMAATTPAAAMTASEAPVIDLLLLSQHLALSQSRLTAQNQPLLLQKARQSDHSRKLRCLKRLRT
ncbi:cell division protein FtsK [Vibrio maritimus]|uniref:Cell division protein FtsK n=1 Tax=Vibrio maritimus TaxID=990268 RepID=A0A090S175_9VIBR|nr:cell division protein FtsK [Vibrio maritimus]